MFPLNMVVLHPWPTGKFYELLALGVGSGLRDGSKLGDPCVLESKVTQILGTYG